MMLWLLGPKPQAATVYHCMIILETLGLKPHSALCPSAVVELYLMLPSQFDGDPKVLVCAP